MGLVRTCRQSRVALCIYRCVPALLALLCPLKNGASANLPLKQVRPVHLSLCASLVGVWLCSPAVAAGLGLVAVGGLGVGAFLHRMSFRAVVDALGHDDR